jgi:hypothetical protein
MPTVSTSEERHFGEHRHTLRKAAKKFTCRGQLGCAFESQPPCFIALGAHNLKTTGSNPAPATKRSEEPPMRTLPDQGLFASRGQPAPYQTRVKRAQPEPPRRFRMVQHSGSHECQRTYFDTKRATEASSGGSRATGGSPVRISPPSRAVSSRRANQRVLNSLVVDKIQPRRRVSKGWLQYRDFPTLGRIPLVPCTDRSRRAGGSRSREGLRSDWCVKECERRNGMAEHSGPVQDRPRINRVLREWVERFRALPDFDAQERITSSKRSNKLL